MSCSQGKETKSTFPLDELYTCWNNGNQCVTNAIAFTNATLSAGLQGSQLFAYDVSFTLGELNKSTAEDAAAGYRGKLVLTNAKTLDLVVMPVLKTAAEGGHEIAVEPDWLTAMFPGVTTLEGWNTQFQAENNAGVAAWEAYVLGVGSVAEWNALSMIITQGAVTSEDGLTLTIPAEDVTRLNEAEGKRHLVSEGGLQGVKAVKFELVGGVKSDGSDFELIGSSSDTPTFIYKLGEMTDTVRYFKIRRVYTFANQK